MENFVVSARKYRPATFDSVVGQHHITITLKNAITSNHLAQAFLFCGPRGVGKTTCARILAKTINCQNLTPQTEACNVCDSCRSFNNNASFNVHELDAASNNSVEDIRSLVEQVRYAPQTGKYKIYIIDEVHMLSNSAFNAFLKTLEEPPSYAIFILATTERHKIIPTILSRCQIFDFNRIRIEDMVKHLGSIASKEEISAEDDALHLIAQKADGALRDALSIFDQMVTFSGSKITYKATVENLHILDYDYYFKLTDYFLEGNLPGALLLFDEILKNGFDSHNFILGIGEHFRSLLVCKDAVTVQLLEVSDNIKTKYAQQAQKASLSLLLSGLNIVAACDQNFKNSKNQRLHVELCLMKLVHLPAAVSFAKDFSQNGDVKKKTSVKSDSSANGVAASISPPAHAANGQKAAPEPVVNGANSIPTQAQVTDGTSTPKPEIAPVTSDTAINKLPPVPTVPLPAPKVPEDQFTEQPFTRPAAPLAPAKKIVKLPSLSDIKAKVQSPVMASQPTAVVEEEEPETLTNGNVQPVNQFEFETVWNQLKDQKKAEGKMSEYMILNRPVHLTPTNVIELAVENHVQIEQFNAFRADFLAALRNRLRNNRINVKIEVNTQEEGVKLYTSIDKYNYLAERYPILPEIKKRLGLDTSF